MSSLLLSDADSSVPTLSFWRHFNGSRISDRPQTGCTGEFRYKAAVNMIILIMSIVITLLAYEIHYMMARTMFGLAAGTIQKPEYIWKMPSRPDARSSASLRYRRAMKFMDAFFHWVALMSCLPSSIQEKARASTNRRARKPSALEDTRRYKRPRQAKGQADDSDGSDEESGVRSTRARRKRKPDINRRFACPFSKRQPARYEHVYRACTFPPGLERKYIVAHCRRCHSALHERQCRFCGEIWTTDPASDGRRTEIEAHLSICTPSEDVEKSQPEVMTMEQERILDETERARAGRGSDELQWCYIFMRLFPSVFPIPSPYYDYFIPTHKTSSVNEPRLAGDQVSTNGTSTARSEESQSSEISVTADSSKDSGRDLGASQRSILPANAPQDFPFSYTLSTPRLPVFGSSIDPLWWHMQPDTLHWQSAMYRPESRSNIHEDYSDAGLIECGIDQTDSVFGATAPMEHANSESNIDHDQGFLDLFKVGSQSLAFDPTLFDRFNR